MNVLKKPNRFVVWAIVLLILIGFLYALSIRPPIKNVKYGISFSKFHSDELGLDWKSTYTTLLDDLGARKIRLSAHWPMIEPEDGSYNFSEMDFQIEEAEKRNAEIILAIGKRLPGWPECHVPNWAKGLTSEDQEKEILKYIETVVNRYKGSKVVKKWQIENEAFLTGFAKEHCGNFNKKFLDQEIQLVRSLDRTRNIVITDSGEISLWAGPYRRADEFGTTMYLYVWNHFFGPIRYPITPAFFRIKANITELLFGHKKIFVAELGAEPWLIKPILETSIEEQLSKMGIDRFREVVEFSKKTGFEEQYLWGAEWWYWLRVEKGNSEHWDFAKTLFNQ